MLLAKSASGCNETSHRNDVRIIICLCIWYDRNLVRSRLLHLHITDIPSIHDEYSSNDALDYTECLYGNGMNLV